ncbi:KpsF/GutQ family sugar-phosphate isomerase [Novosphingobium ovatum]|uniref:KpsF/GutQ family sugar-phosphate isomerase n=1 Tax=Novosphingobium ovatum TaxID=1908523 RepID=UPI00191BEB17|nr:KpsF/GutQ family sugar-phosphate isomerase [Novosphingobium ovatum]
MSRLGDLAQCGARVIAAEARALDHLARAMGQSPLADGFAAACRLVLGARRVVVCGMGKSGLIGRKLAASLCATGKPACFLHPAEAAHGDLGLLMAGDVVVMLSNSGGTRELMPVLGHARRIGLRVIGIVGQAGSWLAERADVALILPKVAEAEGVAAPTTSTAMQMAMGDGLALAVMAAGGVSADSVRALHPGGSIGLALTRVGDVMHRGDGVPLIDRGAPMAQAVAAISRHRFGIVGVVDGGGVLVGVITDGDLRRHVAMLGHGRAGDVMTRRPRCVAADTSAADALQMMNDAKITAIFVVEQMGGAAMPCGIIHMHDLLQIGLN